MESSEEFQTAGHQMLDYLANYLDTIGKRRVTPNVTAGYMRKLLPEEAPEDGEPWEEIFRDIDRVIMPGVTHWQSPHFHAYYPAGQSWPSVLADMLCSTIASVDFTWSANPASTELEVIMMDWLGKLLQLPPAFLNCSGGPGGGLIQGSASEATLVALLAAKSKMIKKFKTEHPDREEGDILVNLIAYGSDQNNACVERAAMLGGVKYRSLPTGTDHRLYGDTLDKALAEDRAKGLVPFCVVSTLGTTGSCAFDDLATIGPVCQKAEVWLHIDAAYAGVAFMCEEFRPLLNGVEYAQSFNFNPHKWMLVSWDCSAMWYSNANDVIDAFATDPLYLRYGRKCHTLPDYRHWEIPLGRRFRALKLWFVLRSYGAKGIRAFVRKHVSLAQRFHRHVEQDSRFEIVAPTVLGLVCFRLKGDDTINDKLLHRINENGKIRIAPSVLNKQYSLRFALCNRQVEEHHIDIGWQEIQEQASFLLATNGLFMNGTIREQGEWGSKKMARKVDRMGGIEEKLAPLALSNQKVQM